MIKRYTNKDQNIKVSSTQVYPNQKTPDGELKAVGIGANNRQMLIKFSGLDLSKFEKIGKATLRLLVKQQFTASHSKTLSKGVTIHRNVTDFNVSAATSTSKPGISPDVEASFRAPLIYNASSTATASYSVVNVDITEIMNQWKEGGFKFYGLTLSSPSGEITEVVSPSEYEEVELFEYLIIEDSLMKGIVPHMSFSPYNCGFAGKGMVNDLTGELVFKISGYSTASSNVPINITAFRASSNYLGFNQTNLMGSAWRASFEYGFKHLANEKHLLQPNGTLSVYVKKSRTEAMEYEIETSESHVFIDFSTGAYLTENGTTIKLNLNDGSTMEFSGDKLRKVTFSTGETIEYIWKGSKLSHIINSESERVDFTYNATSKIETIEFENERRLLHLEYSGNEISKIKLNKWIIDKGSSTGSRRFTEIESATYYKTSAIFRVVNDRDDNRFEFAISNNKISRVKMMKNTGPTLLEQHIFNRDGKRTIVENGLGVKKYMHFDSYGQLTHVLDDYGKSYNLGYKLLGKEGTIRRATHKSEILSNKGNLIVDHSFDANIHKYYDNVDGWKINTSTNNIVKAIEGGVYGGNALLVRKTGSGTTRITQEINVSPGKYTFVGFEKRTGITGNPKIKAIASYNIRKKVTITGSQTGVDSSTGTSSGTTWVTEPITTEVSTNSLTGTTSKWRKFQLNVTIPDEATDCKIKLEIYATHTSGDLMIDDFQLSESEHSVNYNLIPNGYFSNNRTTRPVGWDYENLTNSDILVYENNADPYLAFIGDRVMRLRGDYALTKTMSKKLNVSGHAGEEVLFTGWFNGRITGNIHALVKITLDYEELDDDVIYIPLNPSTKEWQNVTKGIISKDAYKGIRIAIEYRGVEELLFDALQLYINSHDVHFYYDNMSNDIVHSARDIVRDSRGNIIAMNTASGNVNRFKYDDKNRIIESTDNKGNKSIQTYDSKGNQTKTEAISEFGKNISEVNFDSQNRPTTLIDNSGNITSITYDGDTFTQVINAEKIKDKYYYDDFNQLIKLIKEGANGVSEELRYEYNSKNFLEKIILDDSNYYHFVYDTSSRLKEVKLNDKVIVKYNYNSKHQKTRQTFGENGDYHDFTYDIKGRLSTVTTNNNSNTRCTFKYDELDRIAQVDYKNRIVYYSYDRSGKLIKKTSSDGQSESYIYDNLDALQKIIVDVDGIIRSYEYIHAYENMQYNIDGFINRMDRSYDDDYLILDDNLTGDTGVKANYSNNVMMVEDQVLRYPIAAFGSLSAGKQFDIGLSNTRRLICKADGSKFDYSQWKTKYDQKRTIYGWFRFQSSRNGTQEVMRLQTEASRTISLRLLTDGSLSLSTPSATYNVSKDIFQYVGTEWTLIAMQIEKSSTQMIARIYANGKSLLQTTAFVGKVNEFDKLTVGIWNTNSLATDKFDVAYLGLGAYDYDNAEMNKMHSLSASIFKDPQIRKTRTGVIYHDHKAYANMDVVTLKGTLISEKGIQPISYGHQAKNFKQDKNKLFEYDTGRDVHVYGSYDNTKDLGENLSKLIYDFNLNNTGTISMRFKPIGFQSKSRTVVAIKNKNDQQDFLKLFINSGNQLYLSEFKTSTGTTDDRFIGTVRPDQWNQLVVTWSGTTVRVHLNEETSVQKSVIKSLSQCLISIGASLKHMEPQFHLNGQCEMLAVSNSQLTASRISSIINSHQTTSVETIFDSAGRKEKDLIKHGSKQLEASYKYKKLSAEKMSYCIDEMKGFTGEEITYHYDKIGHVIGQTDESGRYEYEYDFMGRLIKEYNPVLDKTIRIEYTKFDILSKKIYQGKTSTLVEEIDYSINKYNQLNSVKTTKNSTVTQLDSSFSGNYFGNPNTYLGKKLEWEGRRLVKIVNENISYDYDIDDLRTKKVVGGKVHNYYWNSGKLILESVDGKKIIYNYGIEGKLVGFEFDSKQYFYNKDVLGIIREIIDENGTTLVTYRYDAWGNWINKNTASNGTSLADEVKDINGFIYKSYYFDKETEFYYLHTRYYDPKIGRFLNADEFSFMIPGQITNVNMFTYSANNPISRIDIGGNNSVDQIPDVIDIISNVFEAIDNWGVIRFLAKNKTFAQWESAMGVKGVGIKMTGASKAAKIGKVLAIVAIFADGVMDVYTSVAKGENLSYIAASAAVTVGLGFGNMIASGAIGAAIGSFIPVPILGTAIGFIIGVGVGYLIDWFANVPIINGKSIVEWTTDLVDEGITWVCDTAVKAWEHITVTVTETWNTVTSWVTETWDDVTTWVSDTWDDVTTWVSDTRDDVTTWVSDTWNDVTTWGSDTWNDVTDVVSNGWETVKSGWNNFWSFGWL